MAPQTKWTDEKLRELQKMLDSRMEYGDIATAYGITVHSLYNVIWMFALTGKAVDWERKN